MHTIENLEYRETLRIASHSSTAQRRGALTEVRASG